MTEKQETRPFLEGFRAAGYCAMKHPHRNASCTRQQGHSGDHVDYYNGRKSAADIEGHRWPQ